MIGAILKLFLSLLFISLQVAKTTCNMENRDFSLETTNFGFDLYRDLAKHPGNVFFSPVSISFALGMTSAGLRGETLNEVLKATKIQENELSEMHSWFCGLNSKVFSGSQNFTLELANKLFGSTNYPFLQQFLDDTLKYYSASLESVDFSKKEETLSKINGWVAEKTNDKIKNLLSSDAIDSLTKLVLVNAIYFKADWNQKFNANKTRDHEFFVTPEKEIQIPTMFSKIECNQAYSDELKSEVIELPYKGEKLGMVVILPTLAETSLENVETNLTAENLSSLRFYKRKVNVWLPKFKMEPSYGLNQHLKNLGINSLFSSSADLSGMDGTRNLYVSSVVHKAFIDVNEEGSEAAAATAVVATFRSMPMVHEFKANHPFLFLIRDMETKVVLFMGRFTGE